MCEWMKPDTVHVCDLEDTRSGEIGYNILWLIVDQIVTWLSQLCDNVVATL